MKFNIILFILLIFTSSSALSVTKNSTTVPQSRTLSQKIQYLQPAINPEVANEYAYLIKSYCMTLNEDLVVSIIMAESSFRFLAESKTGDYGLFQISLSTWSKELGVTKTDLFNPVLSIENGCKILNRLKKQHKNDLLYWRFYNTNKKPIHIKYIERVQKIYNSLK